jgi:hypothetical protein
MEIVIIERGTAVNAYFDHIRNIERRPETNAVPSERKKGGTVCRYPALLEPIIALRCEGHVETVTIFLNF